ncbi:MAG TPA: DUF393 domain-containing protein [Pyrinomonadaceae bacterium]|nr:DUF393 domain-containing protein [Pyrinomonadaceae bacterium]
MISESRIEIYTDGQCPLCRWMRARVEPFDRKKRIEWLDYNSPENQERAKQYTLAELSEEMHVRDAKGRWTSGYWAWLEVLRVFPGWRALAPILSIWPFTFLGPRLYGWVGRRRYTLFGIPPPCDANGVCKLHDR